MNKPRNFLNNFINPFKSNSREGEHNEEDLETIAAREQKHFPFETLVAATNNFHPNQKLGHGGFGPVYKGKLDDGRKIAVKKLSHSLNQKMREFINEAKLLTRVNHRNVVSLLGYCRHGTENLLVYEYVHNESLDKVFLDNREKLDWKRRHGIIIGIARGLLYLHEGSHICIIHRDIKASNILLDDKWVPKISDFGMDRLFPEDLSYVNTRVAATNGYMAPEYVMHGYLSMDANVFSFGVLVLELISGQKNSTFNLDTDAKNLLDWAYKMHKKGKGMEIMDPTLASSAVMEQVALCIHIGLLCTQGDPQLRPTMRRVVLLLSKKPDSVGNLDEPTRPGLPGSRYRRARRSAAVSSSSAASNSGESGSHAFDPTEIATTSAPVRRFDPNGKRPMQI